MCYCKVLKLFILANDSVWVVADGSVCISYSMHYFHLLVPQSLWEDHDNVFLAEVVYLSATT